MNYIRIYSITLQEIVVDASIAIQWTLSTLQHLGGHSRTDVFEAFILTKTAGGMGNTPKQPELA